MGTRVGGMRCGRVGSGQVKKGEREGGLHVSCTAFTLARRTSLCSLLPPPTHRTDLLGEKFPRLPGRGDADLGLVVGATDHLERPELGIGLHDGVVKLAPYQALGVKDRICRVERGLVLRRVADVSLGKPGASARGCRAKGDAGRSHPSSGLVWYDLVAVVLGKQKGEFGTGEGGGGEEERRRGGDEETRRGKPEGHRAGEGAVDGARWTVDGGRWKMDGGRGSTVATELSSPRPSHCATPRRTSRSCRDRCPPRGTRGPKTAPRGPLSA